MKPITCNKCQEVEEFNCRTGASIDSRYYCQVCYHDVLDEEEDRILHEMLEGGAF